MLPPLPKLSKYGISPEYGFLPADLPLERLPDPYYNKWEAINANLQGLILSKRLRGVIDRLPVLSTAGLEHDSEWRRAYSLLCFMAHSYIWGGDNPEEVCRILSLDPKALFGSLVLITCEIYRTCRHPSQSPFYTFQTTWKCHQSPHMLPSASGTLNHCSQMNMSTI